MPLPALQQWEQRRSRALASSPSLAWRCLPQDEAGDEGWQEGDVRKGRFGEGQASQDGCQSLASVSAEEEHLSLLDLTLACLGRVDLPRCGVIVLFGGRVVALVYVTLPTKKKK